MDSGNTKKSVNLPEDIMEDIILRLPVKSMMRFKCVSKAWGSLISSKRFIKAHLRLQNSRKNTASAFAILERFYDTLQCSLPSLFIKRDYSVYDDSAMIFTPPGLNNSARFHIMGCRNGLVLFYTWESGCCFFSWNPSTKICKELPKADLGDCYLPLMAGSGWDEEDGSYKIFAVGRPGVCRVYSSEMNSWKTVEHPAFEIDLYKGQSAKGKFHWLVEKVKDNVVVTFDLKSEVFGTIELPFTPSWKGSYRLGELGGCLCIMHRSRPKNIWIMKEYGVKESWLKLDTISHVREILEPPFSVRFEVGSNGEIMLVSGSTFLVYYPQTNAFGLPKGAHYHASHLCVETLV